MEELRELGSGTFGTVYHGKWRGTDVAIKRINDRCFAGKPSEQERMVSFIVSLIGYLIHETLLTLLYLIYLTREMIFGMRLSS